MNDDYIARIEDRLAALAPLFGEWAMSVRQPTGDVVILRVDLRFIDGARFEGNEVWEAGRRKYRFQLMGPGGDLRWRRDNAPHHRELRTDPDHEHLPSGVVRESRPLTLEAILVEVGGRDAASRETAD